MKKAFDLQKRSRRFLETLNEFRIVKLDAESKKIDEFLARVRKHFPQVNAISGMEALDFDVWREKWPRSENFSKTLFHGWSREALSAINEVLSYVVDFTREKKGRDKEELLKRFALRASEEINPFPIMVNGNFNYTPAESVRKQAEDVLIIFDEPLKESENAAALIWHSAIALGQSIRKDPARIKICPYCALLFWDSTTKSAKRIHCGKINCKRKYDAERSKRSYDARKGQNKQQPRSDRSKKGGKQR